LTTSSGVPTRAYSRHMTERTLPGSLPRDRPQGEESAPPSRTARREPPSRPARPSRHEHRAHLRVCDRRSQRWACDPRDGGCHSPHPWRGRVSLAYKCGLDETETSRRHRRPWRMRRAAIMHVASLAGRRLRTRGLRGQTVTLKIKYDALCSRTAQRRLPSPSDDERVFGTIACDLLSELWRAGQPVRLIGVGMSCFGASCTRNRCHSSMRVQEMRARAYPMGRRHSRR